MNQYDARHRDDSPAADAAARRRDRIARVFGQPRTPRHSAEHRMEEAA